MSRVGDARYRVPPPASLRLPPRTGALLAARRSVVTVIALVAISGALVLVAATLARPSAPLSDAAAAAPPRPSPTSIASPTASPTSSGGVGSPTPLDAPTDAAGIDSPPIVLAFAGDVHGERQIAGALAAGEHPLADIAPVLGDADLTIVNLETSVGSTGTPATKTYTFQAPAMLLDELVRAGVDVVSLANNHSLDYGLPGLIETLDLAQRAGLAVIGAGEDATTAYAASIHQVRDRTVALVGLTRVWPEPTWGATDERPGLAGAYDLHRAVTAVVEARAVADVVVAVVHWGAEGADCPDHNQLELAGALLAAGATAVVGHHPHVLQPVVHRNGGLAAYSLGNFLWYTSGSASRLTGVLRLEIDDSGVSDWTLAPAVIHPGDGGPRPASGADADAVATRINRRCQPPR